MGERLGGVLLQRGAQRRGPREAGRGRVRWRTTSPSVGDVSVTAREESVGLLCASTIVIHASSVAEPP